jgi:hypothetical protein
MKNLLASRRQSAACNIASFVLLDQPHFSDAYPSDDGLHFEDSPPDGSTTVSAASSSHAESKSDHTLLYVVALISALRSLATLENALFSSVQPNRGILHREICVNLRDVAQLIALSPSPRLVVSIIDIERLLAVSTHLIAIVASDVCSPDETLLYEAVTFLYGSLFSSCAFTSGLVQVFDDDKFEKSWLRCFFGGGSMDFSILSDLRHRPGVMAIADQVRKSSLDINVAPTCIFGKMDIGIAVVTFLDAWRISQGIVQLGLADFENIRLHFEPINRACLNLAKLCTYECGREV